MGLQNRQLGRQIALGDTRRHRSYRIFKAERELLVDMRSQRASVQPLQHNGIGTKWMTHTCLLYGGLVGHTEKTSRIMRRNQVSERHLTSWKSCHTSCLSSLHTTLVGTRDYASNAASDINVTPQPRICSRRALTWPRSRFGSATRVWRRHMSILRPISRPKSKRCKS